MRITRKTIITKNKNISNFPQLESIFTGGHWFTEPNMITFFIRFENNQNQLNFDLSSINASLALGNEKVLMNGDMNVFGDHGLFTTVSMPRIGHCRSYYFELFTPDGYNRWPKKNVLYTIEGGRCLMPLNESLAWFLFIVDLAIALAYFTIPIQLIYFMRKAPKLPFPLVFALFSAFIILCGATHIVAAWMPWNQSYVISAIIKVICAVVSLITAGALVIIIPKALELPLLAAQYKDEISSRLLSERFLRDENQLMSNFRRVIHAIREILSKNVIYDNTVSQLYEILDADRCQIFIMKTRVGRWECVQDSNQMFQQKYNTTNSQLNPNSLMIKNLFKNSVTPYLGSNDTELYDLYIDGDYDNLDSIILVPISMSEKEYGVIILQRWKVSNIPKNKSREDWTSNTLTFLSDLAEQISIALTQSSLIEKDKARISQLAEKNEALELARKEASAIQAHREFLAVMSHEMRTPLYAIFALTSILLEMPNISDNSEMSEMRDLLEIIKKSGDMLIAIINNVLDFSKYEEEHLHLERIPFCVQEAIETSLDIVSLQGQESSRPRINYFIDKNVPYNVVGDMTRFRQIIVNLLSNACKFTQADGDVMIKVDSEHVTINGTRKVKVIVEVTDTGIGISKEVLPRLFEKFSQADASITRKYGGTGLGLAIVSKLIKLMDGDIRVEPNTRDKSGTIMIFHVYLEEDPNSPSYPTLSPTKTSKSICVLEKYNSNRIGLKQILRQCGSQKEPIFFNSFTELIKFKNSYFDCDDNDNDEMNDEKEKINLLIINLKLLIDNNELDLFKAELKGGLRLKKWSIMILVNSSLQTTFKNLKIEGVNIVYSSSPVKFKPIKLHDDNDVSIGGTSSRNKKRRTMSSNNNNNDNKSQNEIFKSKKQQRNLSLSSTNSERSLLNNNIHKTIKRQSSSPSPSICSNILPSIKTSNIIPVSSSIKITQQPPITPGLSSSPIISSRFFNINGKYNSKDDFGLPKLAILVVEDNQINQLVTSRILSKLNQKCEIAGDGKTAIKKCDEKIYDVIFMDISMADMDIKRPWIIALTANALWHDRLNCIESGMNDFVSKPARKEDIRDALIKYVNQANSIPQQK
nr:13309_t:CDS:10 [Entrophospora candida]